MGLAQVGAKAWNLGRMLEGGLPVPDGFVITTPAYELWIGAQAKTADESESATPRQNLAMACFPNAVREAIQEALQPWRPDQAWAVRSSATAEDADDASFAGQYDSSLNVCSLPDLLAAIRQCWISASNARAAAYRQRHLPSAQTKMAVLVQAMVRADVAGVIFTADPLKQDCARMILEAAPGLGDALVAGKVSPDRVVLDKETLHILDWQEGHTGNSALTRELAIRIGQLARATEQLFAKPQDIEWAARDGIIFLVQARAITTLADGEESAPEIWTNANVMEALPEVVTPMAWSIMEILQKEFLLPFMTRIGVDTEARTFCKLIAGRAYLNVRMTNDLVRTGAGFIPVDVTTAFGGLHAPAERSLTLNSQAHSRARARLRPWQLLRSSLWLLPGLFRQQRVLERWGKRVFGDLARTPPQSLTNEQLGEHPRALLRLALNGAGPRTWAAAAWMAAAGVGGSTLLFTLTRKWLKDVDGSIANRLLAGASKMNSAENGLALLRLAAWVRPFPWLNALVLQSATFDQLAKELAAVERGPEFLERWAEFLREHGHQARGGMDIFQPRWREMPDFVLDMLRAYLRFDAASDPLIFLARQQRERSALVVQTRRQLRNPLKRWFLTWLLRISQRGLAQRENVKNEGVRLVSVMREAVLETGRRLVDSGLLNDPNDVFFLRLDELGPALSNVPGSEIPRLMAARKAEHARLSTLSPPPVVVGTYDPATCVSSMASARGTVLRGLAVSPGIAMGKARVILQADVNERLAPGEILVAPYTDPGWTPYFLAAAAVVVDVGGMLSHGSVVAREYGLPAVVNVGLATQQIKTGQLLRVDGHEGTVTLLSTESQRQS